jgi:glutaredoxin/glutathione-dependent peroxiredoxin
VSCEALCFSREFFSPSSFHQVFLFVKSVGRFFVSRKIQNTKYCQLRTRTVRFLLKLLRSSRSRFTCIASCIVNCSRQQKVLLHLSFEKVKMMYLSLSIVLVALSVLTDSFRMPQNLLRVSRKLSSMNDMVPTSILCDIIQSSVGGAPQCKIDEAQDFGALLSSHKKAVLFAVPGAFTPTCSVSHLPGFIANADAMRSKGVDAIYCISVNDRFVMKCWGDATAGFSTSGVQLVADGNGEFSTALKLTKDATGSRMGIRSQRYAMIVESGKITALNVDVKGLLNSSAEEILKLL